MDSMPPRQPQQPEGYPQQSQNQYQQTLPPVVTPHDKVSMGGAISNGFHVVFSNKRLWLLFSAGIILINIILSIMPAMMANDVGDDAHNLTTPVVIAQFVAIIVNFAAGLIAYRALLKDIDAPKATFEHLGLPKNAGGVILASLIPAIIMGIIYAATISLADGAPFIIVILMIASVLVTPLYTLAKWLLVDGRVSNLGDAFREAYRLGKNNYGSLLGFAIIVPILVVIMTIFTLGIASIIVLPFTYAAEGALYRRITLNDEKKDDHYLAPQQPDVTQ